MYTKFTFTILSIIYYFEHDTLKSQQFVNNEYRKKILSNSNYFELQFGIKDYTVNNNLNIGENNEPLQLIYYNVMFYACKYEDNTIRI